MQGTWPCMDLKKDWCWNKYDDDGLIDGENYDSVTLPLQTSDMDHGLNDVAILGLNMLLMDGVRC